MRSEEELFAGGTFAGYTDEELMELRELFVRNRFAEKQWFGRPDIEEWFTLQGPWLIKESDVKLWEGLLSRIADVATFDESPEELLRKYGARYPTDLNTFPAKFRQNARIRRAVHDLSSKAGWHIFFGGDYAAICVRPDWKESFPIEASHSDGGTWRAEPETFLIVSSIFLAWKHGKYGKCGRGFEAGVFLRQLLRQCIKTVRAKAERDFDGANAVSLTGDILTFDRMQVRLSGFGSAVRHDSSVDLQGRKVFLSPDCHNVGGLMGDSEGYFLKLCKEWAYPQAFARNGAGSKFFYTLDRFMPPAR